MSELPKPKTCLFCGKAYMHPCDGNDKDCPNAIWLRQKTGAPLATTKRKRVKL